MAPSAFERAAAEAAPSLRPPLAACVSAVICTKDRPEDVLRAVASVRASGEAGMRAEIVVVEECAAPRDVPDVRYVHLRPEGRGFAYARNAGVEAATGDVVAFLDDDCEAAPGWLDALLEPLRGDPAILGVAGAVLVRQCSRVGYAENILGFPGGGLRYLHRAQGHAVPTRHLSTCNCAYRRDAIRRAGGFPDRGRLGGEDYLLAEGVAALGRCVYTPHAVVYHRPRGRLASVFRWFARRGQSEILLRRAVADRRGFTGFLVRSSWTLRLIALALLLWEWPGLIRWLPALAGAYYAALLWRFRFAVRYPAHRRAWWLVPIVKWTMDLGTELGRWRGLLTGTRRP